MARRHDPIPPFEIMHRAPPKPKAEAEPDSSVSETESSESSAKITSPSLQSWLGGGPPIVLRIPRGLALTVFFLLLGLLILAYFAGRSQGYAASEQTAQERQTALDRNAQRPPPANASPGSFGQGNLNTSGNSNPRLFLPGDVDPRAAGLNYPIVARVDLNEARRLGQFLTQRGLDTLVVSAHNTGLFHVIPLIGMTAEQYRAGQHLPPQRQLRDLGRQWKIHNNNTGDDLSSLYWQKYEP